MEVIHISEHRVFETTGYVLSVAAQISFRDAGHSLVSFIDILTNELFIYVKLLVCLAGVEEGISPVCLMHL